MAIFEAARNSDMTEGRGRIEGFAWFYNIEDAVAAVQNQGVMGSGPGEVYLLDIATDAETINKRGYIVGRKWVYGPKWGKGSGRTIEYAPGFDPRENDPEYAEYVRLREKYGD